MELHDHMSALRELLYHEPSAPAWTELCALLDDWPRATRHLGVAYAADHLARWPDLLREPPAAWRQPAIAGQPPEGWSLVRLVDLVLEHPGTQRLYAIKALRELLRCGLREAMELSEQVPVVLLEGVGGATAQRLGRPLEAVGATLRLRPSEVPWGAAALGEGILHPRPVESFVVTLHHVEDIAEAIRLVRLALELNLSDAHALIRSAPLKLPKALPWLDAQRLVRELEASGAVAHMDPVSDSWRDEATSMKVVLHAAGPHMIAILKVLREQLGLGLLEARQLVESAPCVIRETSSEDRAEALMSKLRAAGAEVTLQRLG